MLSLEGTSKLSRPQLKKYVRLNKLNVLFLVYHSENLMIIILGKYPKPGKIYPGKSPNHWQTFAGKCLNRIIIYSRKISKTG